MSNRRLITVIHNEISPDAFDDNDKLELFYKNLNDNEKKWLISLLILFAACRLELLLLPRNYEETLFVGFPT